MIYKQLPPRIHLISDVDDRCDYSCVPPSSGATGTRALFSLDSYVLAPVPALYEFAAILDSVYALGEIDNIEVVGYASPEGREAYNRVLARKRAESLASFMSGITHIPDEYFIIDSAGEDWEGIESRIGVLSDADDRGKVLTIINGEDDVDIREARIHGLDSGRIWNELSFAVFPSLRKAVINLPLSSGDVYTLSLYPHGHIEKEENQAIAYANDKNEADMADATVSPHDSFLCRRSWHLSTNAIELSLLIANVTGEYDLNCRLSLALSIHYSALNYGTTRRKFRTFIFRPEMRWWLAPGHTGFFAEAHIQAASFNFALKNWTHRIQDTGGKHPALGGGLGIGYRYQLGRNGKWGLQGHLGAGVYHLDYSRYVNRTDGPLVDRRRRVWAGIDNVELSLVYNFKTYTR